MKKRLVLFLYIISSTGVFAQFKNVWHSNSIEADNKKLSGIYTNGSNFSYTVLVPNEKLFNTVNLVKTDFLTGNNNSHSISLQHKVHEIAGGYMTRSGFNFIALHKEISETESVLKVFQIETDGKQTTNEKNIFTFRSKIKNGIGKVKFTQSPDRKYSLFFIEDVFKQGEKENMHLFMYNENGEEALNKNISLDLDSKTNIHNYPQVTNGGIIYFLKKDREKNTHRYFVYCYNPSINALTHKQITLPNAHISEIKGAVTKEGDFLVGGFTSSEPVHNYEGYYLFKFDQTCTQKFKTQGQFDENTFLKFISKKEYSKNPVINDFYMDNIVQLSSGKLFFTAEFFKEDEPTKDGKAYSLYKDVMLICFDENGKYKTTYKQTKIQPVRDHHADWASYRVFQNSDTLFMMHNTLTKTEGASQPEPVMQYNAFHEKFGSTSVGRYNIESQGETPFFLPEPFTTVGQQRFIAVFSNFEKTSYRLVLTEL